MARYRSSGKYSPLSFVLMLLVCATPVPGYAWLYAYAVWYSPFIYINVFITVAFGLLIGLSFNFIVIKLGKVRNSNMGFFMGLAGGLLGWYIHWAIWLDLAINAEDGKGILISHVDYTQLGAIMKDPLGMWKLAMQINDTGLWTVFTLPVSGFFLGLIWIGEALCIFLAPTFAAVRAESPFSEKEGKWAKEITLNPFEYLDTEQAQLLEAGNLDILHTMGRSTKEVSHCALSLYDGYNGDWYLTVEKKTATLDDKGKLDFNKKTLLKYEIISQELVAILKSVSATEAPGKLAEEEPA
jgi:hypothetical protein